MQVLINVVLPVFLVIGVAALAQTRLHLESRTLSRAVFYLFAPALVFDSLTDSTVGGAEFGKIVAVLLLTTVAMWAVGLVIARLLRLGGPTQAAFLSAILLMNAGNYGLSINFFAFGREGLARASLFFTGSAVLSASLGVYLSARGRASVREALGRVVRMPLVYAAVVGLALNLSGITPPDALSKAAHLLGQASVPAMLVLLALSLVGAIRDRHYRVNVPALGAVAVARLVIAPLMATGIAALIGLQGLTRDVTILQNAMPTAVITTILATEFDSDPPFAALAVLVTTLASLFTVTLLLNRLM